MSTQTSDSAIGLNPAAVGEWILTLGRGEEAPLCLAPVGSGNSNPTYLVTDAPGKRDELVSTIAGIGTIHTHLTDRSTHHDR